MRFRPIKSSRSKPANSAVAAVLEIQRQSLQQGKDMMTPEEIQEEIGRTRRIRR